MFLLGNVVTNTGPEEVTPIYNYAEVLIRRAELSEVDVIKEIIKEAYEPVRRKLSRLPGALQEGLDKIARHVQMGHIYVAIVGNQVVGTMRVMLRGRTGVIARLAVRNSFRGRRIGTVMMDYAEETLRQKNATCIEIEVYGAVEEQVNFYKRRGYVEYGRTIREGEEIILMRRDLCEPETDETEEES
ncbi:MAG: GNAT family N-acetyltransferase [Candidatus Thorarchaeota archaeon]